MPACRSTTRGLGAAALAVLVLTACGSDGEQTASPTTVPTETSDPSTSVAPVETATTTAPTSEPPTTAGSEEDAILAAVDGYWTMVRAASDPPDPMHPDIERFAVDPAQQVLQDSLAEKQRLGQTVQLPDESVYDHELALIESAEGTATVTDCSVDDTLVIDSASGSVLNDAITTNAYRIIVVHSDGGWLVSEVAIEDVWEGIAGCAAG